MKDKVIQLRVDEEFKKILTEKSHKKNMSYSSYIRSLVINDGVKERKKFLGLF